MTKKIRNSLLGVFSLAAMTTMCLSVAFSSKLTVKAEESNVFEMVYGAGIRVSDPTGMRFKTKFSENYYTELTTEDTDTQLFVSIFPYADYINYDISGQDLMPWLDSYYGAGKYINIAMDPTKFYQEANDDCYYANAVIWAKQNNIVNGVDETNFAPNAKVTREQLVTILYRYAEYKGKDLSVGENTNILSYDDFNELSEYAIPAMQWACGSGIITGRTISTIAPKGTATRAEVATMLMRFTK